MSVLATFTLVIAAGEEIPRNTKTSKTRETSDNNKNSKNEDQDENLETNLT